jgi:hypothetical protein
MMNAVCEDDYDEMDRWIDGRWRGEKKISCSHFRVSANKRPLFRPPISSGGCFPTLYFALMESLLNIRYNPIAMLLLHQEYRCGSLVCSFSWAFGEVRHCSLCVWHTENRGRLVGILGMEKGWRKIFVCSCTVSGAQSVDWKFIVYS